MTLSADPSFALGSALDRTVTDTSGRSREHVAELLGHLVDQAREWQAQLASEATPAWPPATAPDGGARPAEEAAPIQHTTFAAAPDEPASVDIRSLSQLEIRSHLKAMVESASESLIWARQGTDPRRWGGIRAVSPQTCRSLDVRVLLRLTQSQVPAAVQAWQRACWQGAEVRVLSPDEAAVEFLAIDGRTACLALPGEDGTSVLREITDPAIVTALAGAFTLAWSGAAKLDEAEALFELLDSEVTRAVLEMLVEGAKDETIARTIGISLRTCRRHAATIMSALTSMSRFQAGYHLGRANGIATHLRGLPALTPLAVPGSAE